MAKRITKSDRVGQERLKQAAESFSAYCGFPTRTARRSIEVLVPQRTNWLDGPRMWQGFAVVTVWTDAGVR